MAAALDPLPVAVVGASGYTGVELLRLLVDHPRQGVSPSLGWGTP